MSIEMVFIVGTANSLSVHFKSGGIYVQSDSFLGQDTSDPSLPFILGLVRRLTDTGTEVSS